MADPTTLLDFPNELLHKILSCFEDRSMPGHRSAILATSRTCKRLRAVAAEFVFASGSVTVRVGDTLAPFVDFLVAHPRAASGLRKVRIVGTNAACPLLKNAVGAEVDPVRMARAAALMPGLEELELENIAIVDAMDSEPVVATDVGAAPLDLHTDPVGPSDHRARRHRGKNDVHQAFSLKKLAIAGTHRRSTLPAILTILAIYDIEHCVLGGDLDLDIPRATARIAPPARARLRALRVRMLRLTVDGNRCTHPSVLTALFVGLARAVVPGALRILSVDCFWPASVRAVGALARRAGDGLIELAVHQYFYNGKDPLRKARRAIDLTACPHLETLALDFHLRSKQGERNEPKHPPSSALAELLARAPPSLTVISIGVYGVRGTDRLHVGPEQPLWQLHALDTLLASKTHFPALQLLECSLQGSFLTSGIADAVREAMEGSEERGVLDVVQGGLRR